ncbi:hypothetical protein AB0D49_17260 [Streptomyces sp. NPDC048290]
MPIPRTTPHRPQLPWRTRHRSAVSWARPAPSVLRAIETALLRRLG